MANKTRGEVNVSLAGREWAMRPTFQALCEIEGMTGKTLRHLGLNFVQKEVRARDVTAILCAGLKAGHGDKAPDFNEIGEAIMDQGMKSVEQPVVDFLAAVMSFYSEGSHEKKAGETSTKT